MAAPMQKSRLGRGLASLIGEPTEDQPKLPPEGDHRVLSIELLRSGQLNPRQDFKESDLEDLANSIRQKGLVQPILARVVPGVPGYEIVAGERRWRAAQRAGLHSVPVIVRELADKEVLELAIIENVQRADLNAMEEAQGYQDLIDRYGYTQETLSEVIGKSRSHLANTVRLLKLPEAGPRLCLLGPIDGGACTCARWTERWLRHWRSRLSTGSSACATRRRWCKPPISVTSQYRLAVVRKMPIRLLLSES